MDAGPGRAASQARSRCCLLLAGCKRHPRQHLLVLPCFSAAPGQQGPRTHAHRAPQPTTPHHMPAPPPPPATPCPSPCSPTTSSCMRLRSGPHRSGASHAWQPRPGGSIAPACQPARDPRRQGLRCRPVPAFATMLLHTGSVARRVCVAAQLRLVRPQTRQASCHPCCAPPCRPAAFPFFYIEPVQMQHIIDKFNPKKVPIDQFEKIGAFGLPCTGLPSASHSTQHPPPPPSPTQPHPSAPPSHIAPPAQPARSMQPFMPPRLACAPCCRQLAGADPQAPVCGHRGQLVQAVHRHQKRHRGGPRVRLGAGNVRRSSVLAPPGAASWGRLLGSRSHNTQLYGWFQTCGWHASLLWCAATSLREAAAPAWLVPALGAPQGLHGRARPAPPISALSPAGMPTASHPPPRWTSPFATPCMWRCSCSRRGTRRSCLRCGLGGAAWCV